MPLFAFEGRQQDISAYGGWRAYVEAQPSAPGLAHE
jgi:hypothetical protein